MWVTITILRSNLLIACIIQENQNLLDESREGRQSRSPSYSRHKPAQAFVTRRGDVTEWMSSAAASSRTKDMESTSTKGQAIKSARGMPWHQEPTKDVTSCDKLR